MDNWTISLILQYTLPVTTAWPELTLYASRDEAPAAIQLARLALRRWRRDPDGTAPQALAPLYLGPLG